MSVGGGADEMQNQANAQLAWLQLAAGVYLSLKKRAGMINYKYDQQISLIFPLSPYTKLCD